MRAPVEAIFLARRDVINMTGEFELRCSWIDSPYCKQDKGRGDWQVETLQIGNVYAYSYLNLSAFYSSQHSDLVLFPPRPWDGIYPIQLQVQYNGPLKKDYVIGGDVWFDEALKAPTTIGLGSCLPRTISGSKSSTFRQPTAGVGVEWAKRSRDFSSRLA